MPVRYTHLRSNKTLYFICEYKNSLKSFLHFVMKIMSYDYDQYLNKRTSCKSSSKHGFFNQTYRFCQSLKDRFISIFILFFPTNDSIRLKKFEYPYREFD